MLKQRIKYVDYNEQTREEDFYFNLTKAEVMEIELSTVGGLTQTIEVMVAKQDIPLLMKLFKELILKAYGEKSPDGKRFIKSKELSEAFSQTEAYAILFMDLVTNGEKASEFIRQIVPQSQSAG